MKKRCSTLQLLVRCCHLPIITKMIMQKSIYVQISSYIVKCACNLHAGFEKCGTSTLMRSLESNPQIFMGVNKSTNERIHEDHDIEHHISRFQSKFKDHINQTIHSNNNANDLLPMYNGFKNPTLLQSKKGMKNIITHHADIDFVVTLRHPVSYFQSLYNFKYRSKKISKKQGRNLPSPLNLIGDCRRCRLKKDYCAGRAPVPDMHKDVCTESAKFHYELSTLNLTPMNTKEELDLLDNHQLKLHRKYKGNIFVSEIGQMSNRDDDGNDVTNTRLKQWTNGVEDFLGLESDSFNLNRVSSKSHTPKLIHICEDQYKPLRDELVGIGTKASKWIVEYFMKSDRVMIANRDHFVELMEKWKYDPCDHED